MRPVVTHWSYTTLMQAVRRRSLQDGVLLPDALLRVTEQDGATQHVTQLMPTQVATVADQFASHGIDFDVATVSPLAAFLDALLSYLPIFVVIYMGLVALSAASGAGARCGDARPGPTATPWTPRAGAGLHRRTGEEVRLPARSGPFCPGGPARQKVFA